MKSSHLKKWEDSKMTHCFHKSSSSALFSSSIKWTSTGCWPSLWPNAVRASRLEMLQLSHSGCSCLLYLAFIGSKNASTDHKRQISNVVGNGGYNFSGFFFEANPWLALVVQRCGWTGADAHWWAGIHQSHQQWFTHITFLHSAPSLPVSLPPFFKILSSWPFSSVPPAVAAFSSPLPPFLPAPRASLPCPSHRGVLQTLTAANLNTTLSPWKSFHRMDAPQQTVKSAC